MPIKLNSASGGSVTLDVPATASTYTHTFPAETGTVLTSSSNVSASKLTTGTVPTARLPAGCIIQVQRGLLTTHTTTTSSSFVDTGMTVDITPSSTTSKIYIIMSTGTVSQATYGTVLFNLVRNGTTIAQPTSSGTMLSSINIFTNTIGAQGVFRAYLDSPATTSTCTYKVQWKVDGGTGYLNRHQSNTDYNTFSELVVMEVAQ